MNHLRTPQLFIVISLALAIGVAGCGAAGGQATATPIPLAGSDFDPIVSVTGEVLPVQWATLSFEAGGTIERVEVEVGDQVDQGDILIALEGESAARASITAAELELVQARQAVEELEESADVARSQVMQELAQARDELDDAEYMHRVRQQGNRASQDTIDAAEARLVLAENEVDRAKAEYDRYSGRDSDDAARAVALRRLANARESRDAALRALNWYTGAPTEIDQALLDADVAVAQARVNDAERSLARMEDGPDRRQLELARTRLNNAEAQLEAAREALSNLQVQAPFSGTISQVHVRAHEWVAPGTPAIDLGDLSRYRIHTTDLNEIDAARVQVGDQATISYDAVPEFSGTGTITELAPKPSSGSGVNYTAILEVDEVPEGVTWGMTAFVDIEVQQ